MFNFESILAKAFKPRCLLCGWRTDSHSGFCLDCNDELPHTSDTCCPQCGLSTNGSGSSSLICGNCLSSPPHFDVTRAACLYQFPMDSILQRYKYGQDLALCRALGHLLSQKIIPDSVDVIIPMPMHPQRLKERGFNQALEIARVFANGKLDYTSTTRQKLTPPQASLPYKERVKNIRGVFATEEDFTGKRVAIVDDVMTTGASLNELAKTLKKAGASHVKCWVVARTWPDK
jgi:ComF family protein